MLLQAIGSSLPAALGIALSPFPVIGIVLILAGPRGRSNGPLMVLGLRKWSHRPLPGEVVPVPNWMASLDDATALKALALGVLLSINPKNLVFTGAATTSMIQVGANGTDLIVAVMVFVLIASMSVLGAVVVGAFGGARGRVLLDSLRQFMVANSTAIVMVVLLILGAKVLGDGLAGLGR